MSGDQRSAFDDVPEIYDRVRPLYPEALFDDLFGYLGTEASPETLEIGPGTGQATGALLARGARVTAVELGPNMTAFLERKFETDEHLHVIWGAFEDVRLPRATFDLVVAATAFHWVDPALRLARSHAFLRPGGALAVIDTNQIRSEADRGFFERCFPIYLRYRPAERAVELTGEDVTPPAFEELRRSLLFDDVRVWRYRWDQRYRTEAYADLVRSYSTTQAMAPGPREGLIADLCALIDAEFGGEVVRPLVITLVAGRRAS